VTGLPIVVCVRVPIQALRIARLRHDGIRLDESPDRRVVVACPIVHQAGARVQPLPCELVGRGRRPDCHAYAAKGIVLLLARL